MEKLSDEALGVMKFAASNCLVQLAMYGALGGEQFYAAMRESTSGAEIPKTERIIDAIKAITEAMGGDNLANELLSAAT